MFNACKTGKLLPKNFEDDFSHDMDLQQPITNMCAYKDYDRTKEDDVKSILWKLYGMVQFVFNDYDMMQFLFNGMVWYNL